MAKSLLWKTVVCACGEEIRVNDKKKHEKSEAHAEKLQQIAEAKKELPCECGAGPFIGPEALEAHQATAEHKLAGHPDLLAIVKATDTDSGQRVKQVRTMFAVYGWDTVNVGPFGSVKDCCVTFGIPTKTE